MLTKAEKRRRQEVSGDAEGEEAFGGSAASSAPDQHCSLCCRRTSVQVDDADAQTPAEGGGGQEGRWLSRDPQVSQPAQASAVMVALAVAEAWVVLENRCSSSRVIAHLHNTTFEP